MLLMYQESLSKAQLETKRTQLDLQRVAKSLADLKVSSSLLEVQLDQSRDTVRQALQQKSAVEVSCLNVADLLFLTVMLFFGMHTGKLVSSEGV